MLQDLTLPPEVTQYKRTNSFNADTVPKGFLNEHSTRAGIWGRLVVGQGSVAFQDQVSNERRTVNAGEFQVIVPQAVHFIEPSKDAEFFVEFYKDNGKPSESPHEGKALL
ncbi:MAG: DUF1971 domain-containing protein [Pseudomonadota bacterium]